MMRRPYNILIALSLLSFLAVPEVSLAAGRSQTGTRAKADFCASVDQFAASMKQSIAKKQSDYVSRESDRQASLDAKMAKQDADRQSTRFTWDNSRDKVYTFLASRASSKAERAALEKFTKSIDLAVAARRKAVDAATSEFKSKVDGGLSSRKDAVTGAIADFTAKADAAFTDAKSDCAGGVSSSDARADYLTKLDAAQADLAAELKSVRDNTALKEAVSVRQEKIDQAAKDFKTAVTRAEEELKKAFPGA